MLYHKCATTSRLAKTFGGGSPNWNTVRYLNAMEFLSSGPLTTTPVAPPERTANTWRHSHTGPTEIRLFFQVTSHPKHTTSWVALAKRST